MDGLKNFFCRNKKCPKYGIRGVENIRVRARWDQRQTDSQEHETVSGKYGETLELQTSTIDDK